MGISTCLCLGTFEQPPCNELAAVIAMDHINLTGWNPLIGENDESVGPRFPDMSKIYYKKIREQLKNFFTKTIGSTPSEKVLVAIEDPSSLNEAETEGLFEVDNYLYTKMFIFEAIAATHARLKVGTVLLNYELKLNNDTEKKIVQYFASLTDN